MRNYLGAIRSPGHKSKKKKKHANLWNSDKEESNLGKKNTGMWRAAEVEKEINVWINKHISCEDKKNEKLRQKPGYKRKQITEKKEMWMP